MAHNQGAATAAPAIPDLIPQDTALRCQLAMIRGQEPDTSCFELRGLTPSGRVGERTFIRVYGIERTTQTISNWAANVNVFVGCAPRTSYTSGRLADIARVWCLWCDADTPESADRLQEFQPAPSLIVASGGPGRLQGYWQLSTPLGIQDADRANRRIRLALGSDNVCDATRVLRPIGGINHKYDPPATVTCIHLEPIAYTTRTVVGHLEDDSRYKPRPAAPPRRRQRRQTGAPNTSGLIQAVRDAPEGQRNQTLYWAARRAGDEGTFGEIRDELHQAAIDAGLPHHNILSTLHSAGRNDVTAA